jgi:hypothetical protein
MEEINLQIPPSLLLYVKVVPSLALMVDPSPPVIAFVEEGGLCEVPPPPVEFVGVLPPVDDDCDVRTFRGLMTVK